MRGVNYFGYVIILCVALVAPRLLRAETALIIGGGGTCTISCNNRELVATTNTCQNGYTCVDPNLCAQNPGFSKFEVGCVPSQLAQTQVKNWCDELAEAYKQKLREGSVGGLVGDSKVFTTPGCSIESPGADGCSQGPILNGPPLVDPNGRQITCCWKRCGNAPDPSVRPKEPGLGGSIVAPKKPQTRRSVN